jgi:hypothetical protein
VSKGAITAMGGKKLTLADYLRSAPSKMFVIDPQLVAFN